jgi:ribonuclease HI
VDRNPDAPSKERPEHWIMYFDSALNLEGAGTGVLLISPHREQLIYALQIHYKSSNNGAEYEALILGLRIVVSLGIKRLLPFGDSKVVIEQFPVGVFVQDLRKPSIKLLDSDNSEQLQHDQTSAPPRNVLMSEKEDDWRKPFIDFILDQLVPDDKAERQRITQQSANYVVFGTDLYRKAASTGIMMKCILRSEGFQLLAKIHNIECGYHVTSTNLVGKAYRYGFYWHTAMTDAKDLVKRCQTAALAGSGPAHHPSVMAHRHVGSRRCRTISYRPRRLQTHTSGH